MTKFVSGHTEIQISLHAFFFLWSFFLSGKDICTFIYGKGF